jgi:dTDP-4-dehydrorhamnose reductase
MICLSPTPPLPILVTGISGVAGYNALPYLQSRYPGQVIGVRQRDNWRLTGPGIEICDAEDRAKLEDIFDRYQFAAVLDCAGNCALKSCELDPAMASSPFVATFVDVTGIIIYFTIASIYLL